MASKMYDLEVVLVKANTADGEPYRYTETVATEGIASSTATALVRRMASGQAIGVPVMPGAEIGGRHIVYVDVTGIVGYANIAALVCDCEADLHHGGAHSESCPLYNYS